MYSPMMIVLGAFVLFLSTASWIFRTRAPGYGDAADWLRLVLMIEIALGSAIGVVFILDGMGVLDSPPLLAALVATWAVLGSIWGVYISRWGKRKGGA